MDASPGLASDSDLGIVEYGAGEDSGSDGAFEDQVAAHLQLKEKSGASRTDIFREPTPADPHTSHGAAAPQHQSGSVREATAGQRPRSAIRRRPQSAAPDRRRVQLQDPQERWRSEHAAGPLPQRPGTAHAVGSRSATLLPMPQRSAATTLRSPAYTEQDDGDVFQVSPDTVAGSPLRASAAAGRSGGARAKAGRSTRSRSGARRSRGTPSRAGSAQRPPWDARTSTASLPATSTSGRAGNLTPIRRGARGSAASAARTLAQQGRPAPRHSASAAQLPSRHQHTSSSMTAGAGEDLTYGLGQEGISSAMASSLRRSGSRRRRPRSAAALMARSQRKQRSSFDSTTRELASIAHQQMLLARTQVQQANAWADVLQLPRRYELRVTVPAGSATADWLQAAAQAMEMDADTAAAAGEEGAASGPTGGRPVAAAGPGVPVSSALLSNIFLSTARGGSTIRDAAGAPGGTGVQRRRRPASGGGATPLGPAAIASSAAAVDTALPAGVELSSQELRVTFLEGGTVQRDVPLDMFLRGDYARLQKHVQVRGQGGSGGGTSAAPSTTPIKPPSKPQRGATRDRPGRASSRSSRDGLDPAPSTSSFARTVTGPAALPSTLAQHRQPAQHPGSSGSKAPGPSSEGQRSAVQAQLLAILQETATLTYCLEQQVGYLRAQGWAADGSQSLLPSNNAKDLVLDA